METVEAVNALETVKWLATTTFVTDAGGATVGAVAVLRGGRGLLNFHTLWPNTRNSVRIFPFRIVNVEAGMPNEA